MSDNKWNERLEYDVTSPSCLVWKNGWRKGLMAGCLEEKNYNRKVYRARVFGKPRMVHRIVWEMFNGAIPESLEIDHINGDATDNRIENLRLVTRKINARNQKKHATNTTGVAGLFKGVRPNGGVEWASEWIDEHGKKIRRRFAESVHGEDARNLAIKARKEAIERIGGYSERHGT